MDVSSNRISAAPKIPFWSDNPNVLFQKDFIFEFFPTEEMTYEQKLNSVSRTILFLSSISFIITQKMRVLVVGVVTLAAIYLLYQSQKKTAKETFENSPENLVDDVFKELGVQKPEDVFLPPTSTNAFGNVLLPEIQYNPTRKPAPPSTNPKTEDDILKKAKQMVIDQNPGQPDIADKLFKDLGEQYIFEQSLQPFYTNPATTIPNDQSAFAEFCYGGMISNKEGNMFAAARNLARHVN